MSGPTTIANATPNTATETAIASPKVFEAAVNPSAAETVGSAREHRSPKTAPTGVEPRETPASLAVLRSKSHPCTLRSLVKLVQKNAPSGI